MSSYKHKCTPHKAAQFTATHLYFKKHTTLMKKKKLMLWLSRAVVINTGHQATNPAASRMHSSFPSPPSSHLLTAVTSTLNTTHTCTHAYTPRIPSYTIIVQRCWPSHGGSLCHSVSGTRHLIPQGLFHSDPSKPCACRWQSCHDQCDV